MHYCYADRLRQMNLVSVCRCDVPKEDPHIMLISSAQQNREGYVANLRRPNYSLGVNIMNLELQLLQYAYPSHNNGCTWRVADYDSCACFCNSNAA